MLGALRNSARAMSDDMKLKGTTMKYQANPAVYVVVTNLVVLSREIKCNDKPAGAGSLKSALIKGFTSALVGSLISHYPFLVDGIHKILMYLNIC